MENFLYQKQPGFALGFAISKSRVFLSMRDLEIAKPNRIHSFATCLFFPATSLCVILRYSFIWLKRLCSSGFGV